MGTALRLVALAVFLAVPAAAQPPARGGHLVRDVAAERERLAARIESVRSSAALRPVDGDRGTRSDTRKIERTLAKAQLALLSGNLQAADDYARRAAQLVAGTAVRQ